MNKKIENSLYKKILSIILITGVFFSAFSLHPYAIKSINQLQNEKNQLKTNIDAVNKELVGLMSNVKRISDDINAKEEEIKSLKENIAHAEKAVDEQYKAIKLRLKYTYENSSANNILTIILGSKSIGDFINRVEYVNSIYKYDDKLLETYDATEKELKELKKVAEEDKAVLEAKRSELAAGKEQLNQKISALKQQMGNIDSELKAARELAAKKAMEDRRRQMVEAARRATSRRNGRGSFNYTASQDTIPGGNPNGSVNGAAIVGYANQFVGNPYVWGGNSLTNGIDCSGFVHEVYAHFGYKVPRYSQAFLSVGSPVGIDYIKPGDIVVYPGHVAIYAGGGRIVEAQDTSHGITNNRSVYCSTIKGIRRL